MTITVPSEEFERKVGSRLQDAKNSVRLPGFRPGKVPMKEVRRRFGPAIRADAAQELMRSCYGESVAEQELWPAGAPRLEVLNMDAGADFEFTASFEVLPDVQLADFSAFKILRPEADVTDADVDENAGDPASAAPHLAHGGALRAAWGPGGGGLRGPA